MNAIRPHPCVSISPSRVTRSVSPNDFPSTGSALDCSVQVVYREIEMDRGPMPPVVALGRDACRSSGPGLLLEEIDGNRRASHFGYGLVKESALETQTEAAPVELNRLFEVVDVDVQEYLNHVSSSRRLTTRASAASGTYSPAMMRCSPARPLQPLVKQCPTTRSSRSAVVEMHHSRRCDQRSYADVPPPSGRRSQLPA